MVKKESTFHKYIMNFREALMEQERGCFEDSSQRSHKRRGEFVDDPLLSACKLYSILFFTYCFLHGCNLHAVDVVI